MNTAALPPNWQGVWRGDTTITANDGSIEMVTMLMTIEPLAHDAHTWRIEYITDAQHSVLAYEISPDKDKGDGHFIVDEKNGVLLDCSLFDATLVSQFQVDGALLMSRFEQRDDTIRVEMVSCAAFAPRSTRTREDNVEVLSYSCRSLQYGVLRRTG